MEHYFSQATCLCGGDHTDLADDVLSGFESVHFCCFFQHFLFCFSEICLRETWFNSLKSQQILFGKAILLQSHVLRIFSPMQFSILFHFMWEKNLDTTQNKPGHLKIRIFYRWESEFRRNCVFIFQHYEQRTSTQHKDVELETATKRIYCGFWWFGDPKRLRGPCGIAEQDSEGGGLRWRFNQLFLQFERRQNIWSEAKSHFLDLLWRWSVSWCPRSFWCWVIFRFVEDSHEFLRIIVRKIRCPGLLRAVSRFF